MYACDERCWTSCFNIPYNNTLRRYRYFLSNGWGMSNCYNQRILVAWRCAYFCVWDYIFFNSPSYLRNVFTDIQARVPPSSYCIDLSWRYNIHCPSLHPNCYFRRSLFVLRHSRQHNHCIVYADLRAYKTNIV